MKNAICGTLDALLIVHPEGCCVAVSSFMVAAQTALDGVYLDKKERVKV